MTKEDAVSELKSRGYNAFVENGVVMLNMPITSKAVSTIERLMKSIGYNASWGIRNAD